MKFLADMGISLRTVEWLREQSYDTLHLRDQGLQRLPDGEIIEKAYQENRIILTVDLAVGCVTQTHLNLMCAKI
jgi:predicted nuclease of predicted toxin-antitoxin system